MRAVIESVIASFKKWKILSIGYRQPLIELPNIIALIIKLKLHRTGW